MKLVDSRGRLESMADEALHSQVRDLADKAAAAVQSEMDSRPVAAHDSISRFDRALHAVFEQKHDRAFWRAIEAYCRSRSTGSWTPYMIVASYAQLVAAYATPGFAEARRQWMD